MKHFKAITIVIIAVITALFIANVCFLVSLYGSIKQRYVDDVEQCLRRADFIEIIDRADACGLAREDGVIPLWLGLKKCEVGAADTPEQLRASGYSQGYKRMDRQIISVITKYLHNTFGHQLPEPNLAMLEEAFRRELNYSGYFPENIAIIDSSGAIESPDDYWEFEHRVDGQLIYLAFTSPLTKSILLEMSGIIGVSAAIAIILAFAFWYLIHIINRLRSIEEMKDDFTNNMTHELKTPIAIAYAANDALLQFPDPTDEQRTRKYLSAAIDQLTKLTRLVENILAMSMERRKNLTLNKEKINLRQLIDTIIEQQAIKLKKDCRFTVNCGDDVAVLADPTHLANVLNNLIDNSIKYSGDSVDITIEADSKHISVSDNGIGIQRKHQADIFSKFFRVPTGNRQDARGYGIGLYYVKSIVERHGWSIAVESEYGKGTKFTINYGC